MTWMSNSRSATPPTCFRKQVRKPRSTFSFSRGFPEEVKRAAIEGLNGCSFALTEFPIPRPAVNGNNESLFAIQINKWLSTHFRSHGFGFSSTPLSLWLFFFLFFLSFQKFPTIRNLLIGSKCSRREGEFGMILIPDF